MWPLAASLPSPPSFSKRDRLSCEASPRLSYGRYLYIHSTGNSLNFRDYWKDVNAFTSLKQSSVRLVIEIAQKTHKNSWIPFFFKHWSSIVLESWYSHYGTKRGNTCHFHGCKQTLKIATSKWLDASKNTIMCSYSLLAWRMLWIFFPWKMGLIKKWIFFWTITLLTQSFNVKLKKIKINYFPLNSFAVSF